MEVETALDCIQIEIKRPNSRTNSIMSVALYVPNPLAIESSPEGVGTEKDALIDISVQDSPREERQLDIIDIRDGQQSLNLSSAIRLGLQNRNEQGHRTLPSLLLWDEQGLRAFEEVTYTPGYYLTNTEIALLETHSHELAQKIEPGTILLELGSGCLRKTGILLRALEALGKRADYYALDLDRNELARALGQLLDAGRFQHVRCHGLHGTYDDGQRWIARPGNAGKPKCVLSLGSTLGSFAPPEVAAFLKTWAETLKTTPGPGGGGESAGTSSRVILGLDGCRDADWVFAAYNDPSGVNRRFILNALDAANSHLGYEAFNARDWTVEGEWDAIQGRHVQYLVPLVNVGIGFVQEQQQQQQPPQSITIFVKAGEKVELASSYKFDDEAKEQLWEESGLVVVSKYMSPNRTYGVFSASTATVPRI